MGTLAINGLNLLTSRLRVTPAVVLTIIFQKTLTITSKILWKDKMNISEHLCRPLMAQTLYPIQK